MSRKQQVVRRHYTAEDRKHWISVLGRANLDQLRDAYLSLEIRPAHRFIDRPRTFRAMGAWFTRCAIETEYGDSGTACVPGRSTERARLVALFDAMLRCEERYDQLVSDVLDPLYYGNLDLGPARRLVRGAEGLAVGAG